MSTTMTRKIQLLPTNDIDETYKLLKDWRYHSFRLANHIMSERYSISQQVLTEITRNPKAEWNEIQNKLMKERVKEHIGKTTKIEPNFGYCLSKYPDYKDNLPSSIRVQVDQAVRKKYKTDIKSGLLKGNKSLSNYKLEKMNIYIPSGTREKKVSFFSFNPETGEYFFSSIARQYFKVKFGRDRSDNKTVVDRIISGDYKMPDSYIKIIDKKIFLFVPVSIDCEALEMDKNIAVGVDLGVSIPAYCALNNDDYKRMAIGSGKEIIDFRFSMKNRKTKLQKSLKMAKGGKGRNKKLKALDRLRDYEANWIKTKNHMISKQIIEFAVKNNAGTIKLELLEGFKEEHKKNLVLKNWTYFQLQEMITYKAKNAGIKVIYIDPYHTSQTCSICGNYEKGQRVSREQFVCKNPECKSNTREKDYFIHADHNAAINIARSNKTVAKKEDCEYYKTKVCIH